MSLRDTVGTLIIFVTHACNLKCSYCLNGINGLKNSRDFDSTPGWDLCLAEFIASLRSPMLHVVLFGGEPTLRWDLCKQIYGIVESNAKNQFWVSLQTNGTFNESIRNEIIRLPRMQIQISMDGDKSAHDEFRVFHNDDPSWDVVKANIDALLIAGLQSRLMVNCCVQYGDDSMADKVISLYELGVKRVKSTNIKESPLTEEHLELIGSQYKKIVDYIVEHPDCSHVRLGQKAVSDLEGLAYVYDLFLQGKSTDACRSGVYRIAVNTDGNLYPCTLLTAPRFVLGNLFTQEENERLVKAFASYYNRCVSCSVSNGNIFCAYKNWYDTGSWNMCSRLSRKTCEMTQDVLTYYYDKCIEKGYLTGGVANVRSDSKRQYE